jgi:hypothetical protein
MDAPQPSSKYDPRFSREEKDAFFGTTPAPKPKPFYGPATPQSSPRIPVQRVSHTTRNTILAVIGAVVILFVSLSAHGSAPSGYHNMSTLSASVLVDASSVGATNVNCVSTGTQSDGSETAACTESEGGFSPWSVVVNYTVSADGTQYGIGG